MTEAPREPERGPVAFLFAGLGSQQVGMGRRLAEQSGAARATLLAADDALGAPLSRLAAEGPEADLDRVEVAGPALVAVAVAEARYLIERGIVPDLLLGYGVGQLAALVVADALGLADAVRLAREAAQLARDAAGVGEHAAAAVVGVERSLVREICQNTVGLGLVEVAGHNAPGQTTIAGTRAAVAAASDRCEEEFGSAIGLKIALPLHTAAVASALPAWRSSVAAVAVRSPARAVIDCASAAPIRDSDQVRQALDAVFARTVLFEESLAGAAAMGVERCVQCGPGSALLGYARRVLKGGQVFETFEAASGLFA